MNTNMNMGWTENPDLSNSDLLEISSNTGYDILIGANNGEEVRRANQVKPWPKDEDIYFPSLEPEPDPDPDPEPEPPTPTKNYPDPVIFSVAKVVAEEGETKVVTIENYNEFINGAKPQELYGKKDNNGKKTKLGYFDGEATVELVDIDDLSKFEYFIVNVNDNKTVVEVDAVPNYSYPSKIDVLYNANDDSGVINGTFINCYPKDTYSTLDDSLLTSEESWKKVGEDSYIVDKFNAVGDTGIDIYTTIESNGVLVAKVAGGINLKKG